MSVKGEGKCSFLFIYIIESKHFLLVNDVNVKLRVKFMFRQSIESSLCQWKFLKSWDKWDKQMFRAPKPQGGT